MGADGDGGEIDVTIFFSSHYAVEFDPDDPEEPVVVYDLESLSWRDFSPARTITMKHCEAWQKASADISRKSIAKVMDPTLKKFIEFMLNPRFKTTRDGDTIEMDNDAFTYRMTDPLALSARQRSRFFAYDRLNAYRKAMIERKLPPTAQLAVDGELERQNFVPGIIDVAVRAPNGQINMTMRVRLAQLGPDDAERVAEAIRLAEDAAK